MARPLVWISLIGASDELASRTKAKTFVFGFFRGNFLQENVFLMQEDTMKVFSRHFTVRRSRE